MLFAVTMTAASAWTAGLIATVAGPVRHAWAADRAHLADLAATQHAAATGTTHTPTSPRTLALHTRTNHTETVPGPALVEAVTVAVVSVTGPAGAAGQEGSEGPVGAPPGQYTA